MTSRKGTIPYEGRITADCHIHTEFSSDSETKITDQVERAIALGLDHICFTDHMDMDYPEGEFDLDTDAYVKRVLELQEEYKDRIRISGIPAEGFLLYRAQFPVKREKSQKLHMAISDFFIYSSALFG